MIKREFKINLKSFIIWTGILVGMFLFVYLIYPYIINDLTMKELDQMMNSFPPEILKAFNMDMSSISSAYGWFKTEGFTFILMVVGVYSAILGGSILLKEENDKTIEYLYSLPIKRSKIVFNKIVVGISLILLMIIILGVFNYFGLSLSGDFDKKQYLLLSIIPLFVALPLFGINLFISTFLHKTNMTVGVGLGMVVIFYLFNILSEISENVEKLKYFTIFTLADTRNVIANVEINPVMVIVSLFITILFITLSFVKYNKKELV